MQYEHGTGHERTELDCAACGHEGMTVDDDGTANCPSCGESYSLVVRDDFALLESGGWTARVTFEVPEALQGAIVN